MDKINVMELVQSLDRGGLERVVVDLIKFGNKDKFNYCVCCLGNKGVLAEELEQIGIEVIPLGRESGLDFGLSFKIASLMKERKIDVLHSHNTRAQIYGAIAAKLGGVKFFLHTSHGKNDPHHDYKNSKEIFLDRFFSRLTDKIICVSEEVRRFMLDIEKVPQDKVTIIRNGININAFKSVDIDLNDFKRSLGIDPEELVIGIVARLSKVKNHKLLIDAFNILANKGFRAKLVIVGDGDQKDELINYVTRLGLAKNVLFIGARKDIPNILSIFDIFVLCSTTEGMPLVILEATAAGIPIVVTNVGGLPELIKDGENGFLVPSDDPEALSSAMLKILSDHSLYNRISETNRKKGSREYDVSKMCRAYEELFDIELLKNRYIK